MMIYIIRRILYAIPILIGVNLITFTLFFVVNSPDDMARLHLGVKHVTPQAIVKWKQERGYDKPLIYHAGASGVQRFTDTIFFQHSARLFALQFGRSDNGRDIAYDIRQRMWPSLAIAVPNLVIGLLVTVCCAMMVAFFRATYIDVWGVVLAVMFMSISSMFYIIGGQFLVGKLLHLVPISGYDTGTNAVKFTVLPVVIGVIAGLGSGIRW